MVGSAIKKYAKEHSMTVKSGIAYGVYKGFMISMEEGSGWKAVSFAVRFPDETAIQTCVGFFSSPEIKKNFRIMGVEPSLSSIKITVTDTMGTMKKVAELVDVACDRFVTLGGVGVTHCSSCGLELAGSAAVPAVMDGTVYYMHEGCLERDNEGLHHTRNEVIKQGSVLTGAVGALAGALIGAVPWAIAYYSGWFLAILGLLIGFLSQKGYELLNGKENKAKGIIIIFTTIIGVIVATLAGIVFTVKIGWSEELGYTLSLADSFRIVFSMLAENTEGILIDVIKDIVLGLLFAFLGAYQTIISAFRSTGKKNNTLTRLD